MPKNVSDNLAAWVIGPYLVIHTLLLSSLAVITWLSNDLTSFFKVIPLISNPNSILDGKFVLFRQIVIAACSAGLGGGVFMIKGFYIRYGYGEERNGKTEFLKRKEIPRFIFLPMSSVLIGPISLCLLKAGAIAFVGFSTKGQVPMFTIVGTSFILGLTYHDTLHAFCEMSKRILANDSRRKKNR